VSKITVSEVYYDLSRARTKIKVLEGGSGSSKTWSVIQYLIDYCRYHQGENKRILVTRQKLTWLKLSALADFKRILLLMDIWDKKDFNKSESYYSLWGNIIYFTGLDEPQKVHGPRWDFFWGNEAIELSYEDCRQVMMRTNDIIVFDYNPNVTDHWIYDRVIPRDDCTFLQSTQLNNPYLPAEQRKEILSYEETEFNISQGTADKQLWEIYGLGNRANIEGVIFTKIRFVESMPEQYDCKWTAYGLDFGYVNNPTAVIRVSLYRGELWLQELIYEPGLVNVPIADSTGHVEPNISDELARVGLSKLNDEIYADSAEKKSIMEIELYDWLIFRAKKGPGSVVEGIDILKRFKLNILESSMKMKKEAQNYKWMLDPKDKEGKRYLNKPVDRFNHGWDAIRYVAMEKIGMEEDFYMEPVNY
jgi:phage terminase large subunit